MAKALETHENFARDDHPSGSSDKSFGLLFAAVCVGIAGWSWWHAGTWWPWALVAAAVFAVLALAWPVALSPLNWVWTRIGHAMGKVMNPIILAIMFYGVMLPIGAFMRWRGNDLLRLKLDPAAKSYWIEREPPGPAPDTMRNQF